MPKKGEKKTPLSKKSKKDEVVDEVVETTDAEADEQDEVVEEKTSAKKPVKKAEAEEGAMRVEPLQGFHIAKEQAFLAGAKKFYNENLAKQPRIRMYFPKTKGVMEREPVTIEGYRYLVDMGTTVVIPEQVMQILSEYFGIHDKIGKIDGKEYRIDKLDDKSREALA